MDAENLVPKAWGEHDLQAGVYLEPHELSKATTYYAAGGTVIQQDAVLNNPNDLSAGYTLFSSQTVNQSSLVTNYISAKDAAWYIQDRWKPISRLAITAGIRPDWISASDRIAKQTIQHSWNWAPRVAGTYVLTSNQRNVVRASWTKITDITNASYLGANAVGGTNTPTSTTTYYNPNGSVLNSITTPGTSASASGRTFDPDRHQGFVREWIVGYRVVDLISVDDCGPVAVLASRVDQASPHRTHQALYRQQGFDLPRCTLCEGTMYRVGFAASGVLSKQSQTEG